MNLLLIFKKYSPVNCIFRGPTSGYHCWEEGRVGAGNGRQKLLDNDRLKGV